MMSEPLEKLASTGLLKREAPGREEIAGLLHTATVRLEDARKSTNAPESRFDLAYNAAHALSLAALRIHGYRTDKRYIVFQALPHTWAWTRRRGGCSIAVTANGTQPNTKGSRQLTRNS